VIGKLSDSFGRRNIMLVCFFYNVVGPTTKSTRQLTLASPRLCCRRPSSAASSSSQHRHPLQVGNTVLFLGQTPIMDHAPWFWIWMALGVVNLWGGVGSAYLADIMPPEWRSIAFVSPATI